MIPFASQPIEAPPDGVYENMPAEDYHRARAWGSSSIVEVEENSLAVVKSKMDGEPKEPTGPMYFGDLAHEYILQPDVFEERDIVEVGTVNRVWPGKTRKSERTLSPDSKADTVAGFRELYPDATVVGEGWLDRFREIRAAIDRNKRAKMLLDEPDISNTELSIFWTDKRTGLRCKARIDRLRPNHIVDIKTTESVAESKIQRVSNSLCWPERLVHYGFGCVAAGLVEDFREIFAEWIVLNREPPFFCVTREVEAPRWEMAQRRRRRYLDILGKAEARNEWPPPPEHGVIYTPGWMMSMDNNNDLLVPDPFDAIDAAAKPIPEHAF